MSQEIQKPQVMDVFITKISESEKPYGFGVTAKGNSSVYIPGHVVGKSELSADDVGTKNLMAVIPDAKGQSDYAAIAVLLEDSALQDRAAWLESEVSRLEGLLSSHGIAF